MTAPTLITSNYQDAIANLPPEAFLGSLLWFTISQADVNLTQARTDLQALGLDDALLRKGFRPVDAFRKATNEIEHKFAPENNQRANFLVRQVGQDSGQSHRHVVLERAEYGTGHKRRLAYDTVAEIVFTRGTKKNGTYSGYQVQAKRVGLLVDLNPEEEAWLTHRLDNLLPRFHHLMEHMDSHAVRSFVRDYIYSLQGILAKESGGLYFVRQEHADTIANLGKWVQSVGSSFHSLPLLNMADQRQMIMQALEDETVKEVERLMDDIATILKDPNRTITDATFDQFTQSATDMQQRLADYYKTLGQRSDRAAMDVDVFTQQLFKLASHCRGDLAGSAGDERLEGWPAGSGDGAGGPVQGQ